MGWAFSHYSHHGGPSPNIPNIKIEINILHIETQMEKKKQFIKGRKIIGNKCPSTEGCEHNSLLGKQNFSTGLSLSPLILTA